MIHKLPSEDQVFDLCQVLAKLVKQPLLELQPDENCIERSTPQRRGRMLLSNSTNGDNNVIIGIALVYFFGKISPECA